MIKIIKKILSWPVNPYWEIEYRREILNFEKENLEKIKKIMSSNAKTENKIYQEKCGRKFTDEDAGKENFIRHSHYYGETTIEKKDAIYKRYWCGICKVYWEEKFRKIKPK